MPEHKSNEHPDVDGRPRLLVLTSTYPRWVDDKVPGFVHELCRRLCADFDIRVVAPHAPGALREEAMDGVEIRRFRYAPTQLQTLAADGGIMANLKHAGWKWLLLPGFLLAMLLATLEELRRWRPAVVHAHWLIPQGFVAALCSLSPSHMPPYLVTSHGGDLFALRTWPLTGIKRFVGRRAAAITVVSQAMVEEMKRLGIANDSVAVHPMGVDLEGRFTPNKRIARAKSELLFVGRLVEKKGLRHLLDALPEVLLHNPDAHLTIAGFGPEEPALRKRTQLLRIEPHVNFLGAQSQDQLPDLYRRATIFVAPFIQAEGGDQEGLGLVTVEAIGCGCPAIVSDLPATRDVVSQEACRVTPASPSELAAAITDLLQMSPEERLSLAERQRREIAMKFDWSRTAESYRQLLNSLAPDD